MFECWDFRDKKAAGEVVTVYVLPIKNYNTFDKAIIVHSVHLQGGFFTLGLPKMFKVQQS